MSAPGGPRRLSTGNVDSFAAPSVARGPDDGGEGRRDDEEKNSTDTDVAVEEWSASKVAAFVKDLGTGASWNKYASVCIQEDIDGSTMVDATIDILVELGFKKIHANKVLKSLQKLQAPPTVERKQSLPMYLPMMGKEAERFFLFRDLYKLIGDGEQKAVLALDRLSTEKNSALKKITKEFSKLKEHISRQEGKCMEAVVSNYSVLQQDLESKVKLLRKNRDEADEKETIIKKSSRITSQQEQPAREKVVFEESQLVMEKSQPILSNHPLLSFSFTDAFTNALEKDFFNTERVDCKYSEEHILESKEKEAVRLLQQEEEKKERRRLESMAKKREDEEKKRIAEEQDWKMMKEAACRSPSEIAETKSGNKSSSWVPLSAGDRKRMQTFFMHTRLVEHHQGSIEWGLSELSNQCIQAEQDTKTEFQGLRKRLDLEEQRLLGALRDKHLELKSILESISNAVKLHRDKLKLSEGEMQQAIRVTDKSEKESRTKRLTETVLSAIGTLEPFVEIYPEMSVEFSQVFKNALTEGLCSVCWKNTSSIKKWHVGLPSVVETTEGGVFAGILERAGGFEALTKGAGGFEALVKGAGGFEALVKGAGGFEALVKGAGGFEALTKGAGGFEALMKSAGGLEALIKVAGGLEALVEGAGGLEAFVKGVGLSSRPLLSSLDDRNITADSTYASDYPPAGVKYSSSGYGWLKKDEDANGSLFVDFEKMTLFTYIETKKSCSYTCDEFEVYSSAKEGKYSKVGTFQSPGGNMKLTPLMAYGRFLKFTPKKWTNYPKMRVEIHGCTMMIDT